ncbi:MAG TPA: hypothetical protein VGF69_01790 [Thermoanaerobaculia bacterium]|jgi:hypothetical protein
MVAIVVGFALAIQTNAGLKDGGRPAAGHNPPKALWQRTDEERLGERFDPRSMRERRAREATEPFGVSRSAGAGNDDGSNVIVGARNPELLLPWELFNHLMNTTNLPEPEHRDGWPRIYAERAAGLDLPSDFWQRLDRVTAAYRTLIASRWAAEALLNNDDRADDAAARMRLQEVDQAMCAERAHALENARLEFGRDWFDRFLYTAPAKSLTVISSDETPADHRRISGGCR